MTRHGFKGQGKFRSCIESQSPWPLLWHAQHLCSGSRRARAAISRTPRPILASRCFPETPFHTCLRLGHGFRNLCVQCDALGLHRSAADNRTVRCALKRAQCGSWRPCIANLLWNNALIGVRAATSALSLLVARLLQISTKPRFLSAGRVGLEQRQRESQYWDSN
jgi:hypothetical protein